MNEFIFSNKYRVWRHLLFWIAYTLLTASLFLAYTPLGAIGRHWIIGFIWLPARMLYCYPLMYWVIPKYLQKRKHAQFVMIILLWFIAGWFLNYFYRVYVFHPLMENLKFPYVKNPFQTDTFLLMTTAAGITSIIKLFQNGLRKQQQWQQAEKEKIAAELQLLKAQVHPHFLFNTLNNIYSFSLENSPKTPALILKLSSLLRYMLYECNTQEVLLEKEIGVMKNYVDLEKERYGDRIDISWSVEGTVSDKFITPLLIIPFLENAFKHGASEQIERPWLSVDIALRNDILSCKIANSKSEYISCSANGIGINNVKKRLELIYPEHHELKINDEGNFFVVSLQINLNLAVKETTTHDLANIFNQKVPI